MQARRSVQAAAETLDTRARFAQSCLAAGIAQAEVARREERATWHDDDALLGEYGSDEVVVVLELLATGRRLAQALPDVGKHEKCTLRLVAAQPLRLVEHADDELAPSGVDSAHLLDAVLRPVQRLDGSGLADAAGIGRAL